MADLRFPHAAKPTLFTSRSYSEINLDSSFLYLLMSTSSRALEILSPIPSFLSQKFTEHLMSGSGLAFGDSTGNDIEFTFI